MAGQSIIDKLDDGGIIAALGKGSHFEGKLTFEGAVRIDGQFSGEIFSEGILIVGHGARVQARVQVSSVVVQGDLEGNVQANDCVELHGTSRMSGDLVTPSLYVEKGAIFQGKSDMLPQHTPVDDAPEPSKE